ncbi:LTA synthase family protein [Xiashengella succiniciproducens]|uniref:Sulfatase-like hydrolase/transferase n=1 Tax=Xiashengella succiniciproducens TaxID=2949635 RepID=A0A9J6ZQI6_9BACT|nr:alkaline phosphatase family protein [Alkaliflexus sp. Ai-910]URW79863.1 sulfatase-like hydrolase/transferase [Alkaliflexus sp. Ai-910]
MIKYLKYLLQTALFLLLFFAFYQVLFLLFNRSYADGAPFAVLARSLWVGLRLNLSMSSYVLLLLGVIQTVGLLSTGRFSYKLSKVTTLFFVVVFSGILLGNINLYAYWGRLLDAEGFAFLKTPWVILASVRWYESLAFLGLWLLLSWAAAKGYFWLTRSSTASGVLRWPARGLAAFFTLFTAAFMLLPIRGGLGVAPINTGVAYFSSYNFANHAAINPPWNLFYSFKRMDARTRHYSFMQDEEAYAIYDDIKRHGDDRLKVLNTDKPNVVFILLESFSSQVVGILGGEEVTPNLDRVAREGILFDNIYAASDRSDKGLVATMAGYQVAPAYSIIQYPQKSQSLAFMPRKFREAGYRNLTYIYGGDAGFKGMNSFVTLAGFDRQIVMSDFPASMRGEKWGVHDEYTFARLADEMEADSKTAEPWFKYYFTLSSHEPFDVPMARVHENPYLNSIFYTDSCLGVFIDEVKRRGLWDNTLIVMIADHGTPGPLKASSQMKERYQIPMLWTGGALAVRDTVISKIGSQKDVVATLLGQLGIDASDFYFSKDLLCSDTEEYAFFTYPDAFGYVTRNSYQVYDNTARRYVVQEGEISETDSLRAKATMQVVSADHLKR